MQKHPQTETYNLFKTKTTNAFLPSPHAQNKKATDPRFCATPEVRRSFAIEAYSSDLAANRARVLRFFFTKKNSKKGRSLDPKQNLEWILERKTLRKSEIDQPKCQIELQKTITPQILRLQKKKFPPSSHSHHAISIKRMHDLVVANLAILPVATPNQTPRTAVHLLGC